MEEEELKQIKKTINDLNIKIDDKIEEQNKSIGKKLEQKKEYAEEKIGENPFVYIAGSFFGGVIVGYMMGRGKNN